MILVGWVRIQIRIGNADPDPGEYPGISKNDPHKKKKSRRWMFSFEGCSLLL